MSGRTVYVDLKYTPKPEGFDGIRWQPWSLLIVAGGNNEPLFRSTERYTNKADAEHAAEVAFGTDTTVYLRESGRYRVLLRAAVSDDAINDAAEVDDDEAALREIRG